MNRSMMRTTHLATARSWLLASALAGGLAVAGAIGAWAAIQRSVMTGSAASDTPAVSRDIDARLAALEGAFVELDFRRRAARTADVIDETARGGAPVMVAVAVPRSAGRSDGRPQAAEAAPRHAVSMAQIDAQRWQARRQKADDWPGNDRVLALNDRALADIRGGQAAAGGTTAGAPEAEDTDAIDDELRALNRVLVDAGGLLLAPGEAEIAPELGYSYRGANGLIIRDTPAGSAFMTQNVRRNTVTAAVTGRLGLPWNSQVDVRVPYVIDQEKVAVMGQEIETHDGTGIGDIDLRLSHQLLREKGYVPDVLAAVNWRLPTGEDSFDADVGELAIGSGFHGVGGLLTATKSYDPLVLFGSLGYTANIAAEKEGIDIDPGDELSVSLGTVLAAGPGSSLRFGLNQTFRGETSVNGQEIAGSDEVIGELTLGAGLVLPGRALLDISAGFGVTEDAPDMTFRVAVPYRL